MLEKREFLERQRHLKKQIEEKKASCKSRDWETQFWAGAHFYNHLHPLFSNDQIDIKPVVFKILSQLIEKTYLYDYEKYTHVVEILEELLMLPPNLQEEKYEIMKKYLNKDTVMLEWGSGYSTITFAKAVKHLYTVEHDVYWYNLIKVLAGLLQVENTTIIGISPAVDEQNINYEKANYSAYINAPEIIKEQASCEKYDVVLIDGRARSSCLESIIPFLHKDSVVLVDDFNRDHPEGVKEKYDNIIELDYEIVEKTEAGSGMIALKKKSN
tara:strand:- start:499 stop:1308 length:810 start_codon:yes stop_codon:yes gene_type:complete